MKHSQIPSSQSSVFQHDKYKNIKSKKEIFYRFCCLLRDEICYMANLNKELIRQNIFQLLDDSGLTDLAFANLLELSEKQIRLIKKEEAEFSIDDINKACDFFRKTINNLNTKQIETDYNLKDNLILAKKKNNKKKKN